MASKKGSKLLRAEKNRDAWLDLYGLGVAMHIAHLQSGDYHSAKAMAAIVEDIRKQVETACHAFEDAY